MELRRWLETSRYHDRDCTPLSHTQYKADWQTQLTPESFQIHYMQKAQGVKSERTSEGFKSDWHRAAFMDNFRNAKPSTAILYAVRAAILSSTTNCCNFLKWQVRYHEVPCPDRTWLNTSQLSIDTATWTWLLAEIDMHPRFCEFLANDRGCSSTSVSRDQKGVVTAYHIFIRTPHLAKMESALYLRHEPKADRTLVIIAASEPQIYINTFRELLHQNSSNPPSHRSITAPTARPSYPSNPFTHLHAYLTSNLIVLHRIRTATIEAIMATEKRSGRGNLMDSQRGQKIDWSKANLAAEVDKLHDVAQQARSNAVMGQRLAKLAGEVVEMEGEWRSLLFGGDEDGGGDNGEDCGGIGVKWKYDGIRERLKMHLSVMEGEREGMNYWRDRALHQISVLDTTSNAVMAMNTRRDNLSMKTIAYLGMIYLPFGLVAQVFATGFFHYPEAGREDRLHMDRSSFGFMVVSGCLLTLVTFVVWFVLRFVAPAVRRKGSVSEV